MVYEVHVGGISTCLTFMEDEMSGIQFCWWNEVPRVDWCKSPCSLDVGSNPYFIQNTLYWCKVLMVIDMEKTCFDIVAQSWFTKKKSLRLLNNHMTCYIKVNSKWLWSKALCKWKMHWTNMLMGETYLWKNNLLWHCSTVIPYRNYYSFLYWTNTNTKFEQTEKVIRKWWTWDQDEALSKQRALW